jgi:hypothetical protein
MQKGSPFGAALFQLPQPRAYCAFLCVAAGFFGGAFTSSAPSLIVITNGFGT